MNFVSMRGLVLTLLLLEFGFGVAFRTASIKPMTVLTLLLLEFGFGAVEFTAVTTDEVS